MSILDPVSLFGLLLAGSTGVEALATNPTPPAASLDAVKCLEIKSADLDFTGARKPGQNPAPLSRCLGCPVSGGPPLTAVMPLSNDGTTAQTHPNLWFYVPYGADEVIGGEFRILEYDATSSRVNTLERQAFQLPSENPGFVSMPWPETASLTTVDDAYYWSLVIYCGNDGIPSTVQFVNGWVRRVDVPVELATQMGGNAAPLDLLLAENHIWIDAVDALASLRVIAPTDSDLQARWRNLMTAKGVALANLPDDTFAGPVLLAE
ncbi:MAG: DUF928 domain-containing protein [Cyanobacteria bacterium J06638_28]